MSSFKCNDSEAGNGSAVEAPDSFRRKLLGNGRYFLPRRYVIALMLFILLLMKRWNNLNISFMVTSVLDHIDEDISIGNWTVQEIINYLTAVDVASTVAQIPGTLLIFTFSSHKYLLISSVAASILHLLTPVALRHHSATLLLVLLSQAVLEAPIYVAALSIWKDWAPPLERSKLIIFAVLGYFFGCGIERSLGRFSHVLASRFYLLGGAGLIWALFWYNMISDTPQNDPLISERELLHLESSIPSENRQKRSVKDVPWKSIVTSKQIAILAMIFLKMSVSSLALVYGSIHFTYGHFTLNVSAFLAFLIVIISSAILADFLIKRYPERTLLIRRCFLCGGFFLQVCFMLGILATSVLVKAIFFVTSYIMYAASFPGFITLPLDLSPQYVAIISGIVYTFFCIGNICIEEFVRIYNPNLADFTNGILLCDAILSLVCAAIFAKWGDVQEQLWSLASTSQTAKSRCSENYLRDTDLVA